MAEQDIANHRKAAAARRHGRSVSLQGSTIVRLERRLSGGSFSALVDKLLVERLDQLDDDGGSETIEERVQRLEAAVLPTAEPPADEPVGSDVL